MRNDSERSFCRKSLTELLQIKEQYESKTYEGVLDVFGTIDSLGMEQERKSPIIKILPPRQVIESNYALREP